MCFRFDGTAEDGVVRREGVVEDMEVVVVVVMDGDDGWVAVDDLERRRTGVGVV